MFSICEPLMISLMQSTPLQMQVTKRCYASLERSVNTGWVLLKERIASIYLYYQSNTYGAIIASKHYDAGSTWSWEQPDGVQNLLLLRHAIRESSFETIEPIVACQIRTNFASRLNSLGRPVAANEQWLQVLETEPRFAKALANRAKAVTFYREGAVRRRSHVRSVSGCAIPI